MITRKVSDAVKDSFGPDNLLWLRHSQRRRGRSVERCSMVMMVMVTIDVMMMRYKNFILN